MGRHDVGGLGCIFVFSIKLRIVAMRKITSKKSIVFIEFLFIITFCFVISTFESYSQKAPQKGKDEKKKSQEYKIAVRYPLNVFNLVTFTEETEVTRVYSDSSELSYTRKLKVWISYRMLDRPIDGFTKVKISIDSLDYHFTDGKRTVKHFSQEDAPMPLNFIDYAIASNPLGQEYELVYSPYYELVRIEGDRLDEILEIVSDPVFGPKDTLQKFITLNWLSDQHLAYWSDIQKNIVPSGKITLDTTWKTPFMFELDGVPFRDSAECKLLGYNAGIYSFYAETKDLKPDLVKTLLYNIPRICDVESGKGSGNYKLKIRATGGIDSAEGDFNAEFTAKIGQERFRQKVKSKTKWELTGFVRY